MKTIQRARTGDLHPPSSQHFLRSILPQNFQTTGRGALGPIPMSPRPDPVLGVRGGPTSCPPFPIWAGHIARKFFCESSVCSPAISPSAWSALRTAENVRSSSFKGTKTANRSPLKFHSSPSRLCRPFICCGDPGTSEGSRAYQSEYPRFIFLTQPQPRLPVQPGLPTWPSEHVAPPAAGSRGGVT